MKLNLFMWVTSIINNDNNQLITKVDKKNIEKQFAIQLGNTLYFVRNVDIKKLKSLYRQICRLYNYDGKGKWDSIIHQELAYKIKIHWWRLIDSIQGYWWTKWLSKLKYNWQESNWIFILTTSKWLHSFKQRY